MSSPDGRFHLVYNGEVYNFLELREQLRDEGWSFRSDSDTEVVLAALAIWGAHGLPKLVGMFALAWFDAVEKRVLLARDVFGIKPLHFTRTPSWFGFASEPIPLLEIPGVSRQLEPQAAYAYLRYGITDHGDCTFFQSIQQLPPAHFLTIDVGSHVVGAPTRYWSADDVQSSQLSYQDAVEQLRRRFLESVRLHLRSDVPVAVALSGGIDSSCITMAARNVSQDDTPMAAFGYLGSEPRTDESRWMQLVVEAAQLQFHSIRPATDQLCEDLDRVITVQQAPFGSLSILAQYYVYRAVHSKGFKVLLSGQGADELLGGYSPFAAARLISMIQQGRLLAAAQFFARGSREWPGRKRLLVGLAQQLLPRGVQRPLRYLSGHSAEPNWLAADWFRHRGVSLHSPRDDRGRGGESLKTALRDSLTHTGLPELLRYEDRNSMAWSVESRVPFLTAPLVEFLLGLPEEHIISDACVSKASLRDAMQGIVPAAILERRDKVAFSAPLRPWLSTLQPWLQQRMHSETAEQLGVFRTPELRSYWERVEAGKSAAGNTFWRCANFVRWAEIFGVQAG